MAELAIINGYDIRDRKLADATTVTGVESSDSIVLKTTGGAYANILKEDFTKAVRSVLGGLLNTADKGTSIEKVACLGTTDHDFGSISTANLASVLGVGKNWARRSSESFEGFYSIPIYGYTYSNNTLYNLLELSMSIENGSNEPHPQIAIRTNYFDHGWGDWKYIRLYNKPQYNYSNES